MHLKRVTAIALGGGALAAWLAAATTFEHRPPAELAPASRAPIETRAATLATEIERLHERLRPTAPLRETGRNLFAFAEHRRAAPAVPVKPALSEAHAVHAVEAPTLKLDGIAEDISVDGLFRTAIFSGFGQLFLVKEGDSVSTRYRVAAIASDAVDLTDLADGTTKRFVLK